MTNPNFDETPAGGLRAAPVTRIPSTVQLPSVRGEGEPPMPRRTSKWNPPTLDVASERVIVRGPIRALAGLLAGVFMLMAMFAPEASLYVRTVFFLGGAVFGGIALYPGGKLNRLLPQRVRADLWLPASVHDDR
ncbi:MAG TPA: hypothetical protein VFJ82_25710 [Longimicrobium sp.]|nr:hypothetical protein [Longimicrobium sp.]